MKGDQAALLDDLVRYGAQFFFPFLRGPLLTKAAQRFALSLLFHTASALEQARLAGYKTTTPDFRQALHLL